MIWQAKVSKICFNFKIIENEKVNNEHYWYICLFVGIFADGIPK